MSSILLARVAGPDLLRRQAIGGLNAREQSVALFTLLAKNLSHGHYADFGHDLGGVPADASPSGEVGEDWTSSWMEPLPDGAPPLGLFTHGKFQGEYACPALATTAAVLASRPSGVKAQLCLGEFWRLNGFDGYLASTRPKYDELGGSSELFPGRPGRRPPVRAPC